MLGASKAMPEFRERRAIAPRIVSSFAAALNGRLAEPSSGAAHPSKGRSTAPTVRHPDTFDPEDPFAAEPEAEELDSAQLKIVARASKMLGIPYVWGGNTLEGLDCSSWLSRVWGVPRQTTDTLHTVADPITKEQLQTGDAMNLPTYKDPTRHGHVRMFDKWADPAHTKMWVYEETADTGYAVHRVIPYDSRYQPMRLKGMDPQ